MHWGLLGPARVFSGVPARLLGDHGRSLLSGNLCSPSETTQFSCRTVARGAVICVAEGCLSAGLSRRG
ncbi:hypothetical protein SBD_6078 [Streptomyces bottropensis ATCC 25435]|uniref:Uncharacterized protein n=1 Tax=Streptomyces bottropensis ATCC 25435 TaxID=1054862 RepID=M3D9P1_9ACTN|nr:hypothetical protein SBD_6078 [Streptomyces bottropensis ATCC 25435]